MNKLIPPELKRHILPFNWDVTAVWSLEAQVKSEPIQTYTYLLELPLWSSASGQGMLFDTRPMDVLNHPERFPHQTQRIQQAETGHPIEMIMYQNRKWILDGVHRIAKLYGQEATQVAVRTHTEDIVPLIQTT